MNQILATSPADSADIGEAQFGGGKRTPIEESEPEIALEVYRQVPAQYEGGGGSRAGRGARGVRALVQKALGGKRPSVTQEELILRRFWARVIAWAKRKSIWSLPLAPRRLPPRPQESQEQSQAPSCMPLTPPERSAWHARRLD